MGKAIQLVGLILMPASMVWGEMTDSMGNMLLGAVVGFSLCLIGARMRASEG